MLAPDYSEIGGLLRTARRQSRLSLDEAASRLHIRARYLESLETGSFRDLPGIAYTKGYLQRYATLLELDKDEILRRFEQVEVTMGKRGFYLPMTFSKEKRPSQNAVWGGLAAAFALYLLWALLLAPAPDGIARVEPPRQSAAAGYAFATMMRDGTCLAPQNALYPLCLWKGPDAAVIAPSERLLKDAAADARAASVQLPWLKAKPGEEE
jgi:transcriptional regulator with XRE-family HTH domain